MKKLAGIMMSVCLMVTLLVVPNQTVYGADVAISASASTVNIGDVVTVTVVVPDGVTASIDVSYPSNLMKFTSCSITANDSGNAVSMTVGLYAPQSTKSATITFSAIAAGTATFTATPIRVGDEMGEEVVLGGASTSVTIANKASEEQPAVLSSNNLLGSLVMYEAAVSPAFHPDVTNYTATVGYDITKVTVKALAADAKAKGVTISGGSNLQVGSNTVSIVVQAENGVTREYKIIITRQEQSTTQQPDSSETPSTQKPNNPGTPNTQTPNNSETTNTEGTNSETQQGTELSWNGSKLEFVKDVPKKVIPTDFEKSTRMINNKEVSVLDFKNGELTLVYLSNENKENGLYVYDNVMQDVYPFVALGEEHYVIVLRPDDANVPAGYVACTLSIEGKGVISAYQFYTDDVAGMQKESNMFGAEMFFAAEPSVSDFYLMYCMNAKGDTGWYLYDIQEKTFQRYVSGLYQVENENVPETEVEVENQDYKSELEQAKKMQYFIMIIAAVVVVILLIIIIVLAVKLANRSIDDDFEDDELDMDEEIYIDRDMDDEVEIEFYEMPQEQKEVKKEAISKRKVAEISDFDDDNDLEFIDLD